MTSGTGSCTSTSPGRGDNYTGATRKPDDHGPKIAPTVTFTGAPASAAYQSTFYRGEHDEQSATRSSTSGGVCSNLATAYTMISGTGSCTATVTWARTPTTTGRRGARPPQRRRSIRRDVHGGAAKRRLPQRLHGGEYDEQLREPVYTSGGVCSNLGNGLNT